MVKKFLNNFEGWFCGLILAIMLVLLVMQVALRWVGQTNTWSEELARYMFVWVVYVGGSFAAQKDSHIRIDLALRVWPKKVRPFAKTLGNLLWIAFGIFLLMQSLILVRNSWVGGTYSICLGINMAYAYVGITIGYGLMVIRVIQCQLIPSIKEIIHKNVPSEGGKEVL
ncbi:TRAP transporter small permease [Anaerovorax odorimutans]|uniref:TRAP transporter small permease n=1 Tax=Anaerovorax odorimutans TaxID=109327 RepID=A0ABT1RNQ0_9FIRM|nr:TRAP transporter small permease [Anaerovorax odorimutans]MCQ4636817.1 TRAP transporter small permease [Anaerovorax odorimutans]